MVSSAIAGVDAWIQQAEEVLDKLREQGLSPSSTPRRDSETLETTITFGAFSEGLEEVLSALCERPGRWVLIAEDSLTPHHFWQAIAYEDGSLFVEVVSNHYLEGDDRLTDADGAWLEAHRWKVPDPPKWPNWSRVEATTSPEVGDVARQAVEAMGAVFGLGEHDLVKTKLFPSDLRGDSPASPDHREECADEDDAEDGGPPRNRHYSRPDPNWTDAELEDWADGFLCEILGRRPTQGPDWCGRGHEPIGVVAEGGYVEENLHPDRNTSDNEIVRWMMLDLGVTRDHQGGPLDWIDAEGGSDEDDPDNHPDPTADDPPFADQELDCD